MSKTSGGARRGTTLAFDYGVRRIGVAVGDRYLATASALTTIKARDGVPDWVALDALVAEWEPVMLVVGVPHFPDGMESPITLKAKRLGQHLAARYKLPLEFMDENLSSRAAASELRQKRRSGLLRRRVTRGDTDKIAARLILEAWMTQQSQTLQHQE